MITGDNPLTACHVAGELKFIKKQNALLLQNDHDDHEDSKRRWYWTTIDNKARFDMNKYEAEHDLCLTGDAFEYLYKNQHDLLRRLIARVKVFARVSPKQKETVVVLLKDLGYYTLMCGDGTNDVGALKHADVGVALLSHSDIIEKKRLNILNNPTTSNNNSNSQQQSVNQLDSSSLRNRNAQQVQQRTQNTQVCLFVSAFFPTRPSTHGLNELWILIPWCYRSQKALANMLKELEEAEQSHVVKLGDASIASPFTSKQSSIQCGKSGLGSMSRTDQWVLFLRSLLLIVYIGSLILYFSYYKISDPNYKIFDQNYRI